MAKFNLTWNSSSLQGNTNVTSQEASWQKKIGGTWSASGFNPANPLLTSASATQSPDLIPDNVIYQFRIRTMCTLNGPVNNVGGPSELIHFACPTAPSLSNTGLTATIAVDLTGTDINKVAFTLRKAPVAPALPSPTDPIVMARTIVNKGSGTVVSITASTGVAYSTAYYWEVDMCATLFNGGINTDVWSAANTGNIGSTCKFMFTAVDPPTCAMVTGLTITIA
jgi:hypothetical protein